MKRESIVRPVFYLGVLIFSLICTSFLVINNETESLKFVEKASNSNYIQKRFVIYDGIRQYNKPNLNKYGIRSINIIYEDSLLDRGVINYKKLDNEIRKASKNQDPICLDIESWDLRDGNYKINGKKYISVFDYFKKKLPGRKIGYFGMLPHRDLYLYKQKGGSKNVSKLSFQDQWSSMNTNIKYITQNNDIAFPSFYFRNKNMKVWKWVTEQQISKLKEINPNIPVYGFIWPQYWSSEFVSANDWRFQLETLYQLCDGVVIWGPSKNIDDRKPISWDNNREWWKETLSFIKRYRIGN